MIVLIAVKRLVDFSVEIRVKADGSGADLGRGTGSLHRLRHLAGDPAPGGDSK